jgi:hypothetical protein
MNRIIFTIYDGSPSYSKINGTLYTAFPAKIFGMETKVLDTDKTLFDGDNINYQGYTTIVSRRVYYPDIDSFDFWCNDIYTGRNQ